MDKFHNARLDCPAPHSQGRPPRSFGSRSRSHVRPPLGVGPGGGVLLHLYHRRRVWHASGHWNSELDLLFYTAPLHLSFLLSVSYMLIRFTCLSPCVPAFKPV